LPGLRAGKRGPVRCDPACSHKSVFAHFHAPAEGRDLNFQNDRYSLLNLSGGQEFEFLRARHLVIICEHQDLLFWLARTAFSSISLLPLIPALMVIDLDCID
jgi:hypothetical protein